MAKPPTVDAGRVIADLRELQRRTGDKDGAQRLCWGDGWRRAREFLGELLREIGLEFEVDEAGNAWAYLDNMGWSRLAYGAAGANTAMLTELTSSRLRNQPVHAFLDMGQVTQTYVF